MASCSDGLTTHEALARLHEDISSALEEYQKSEAEKWVNLNKLYIFNSIIIMIMIPLLVDI